MDTLRNNTEDHSSNIWIFKGQSEIIDGWFLMSNPYNVLALTSLYLLFVLKIGPGYMKNRPPFNLNNIILVYNFVQVLYSIFLVYTGTSLLFPHGLINSVCTLDNNTLMTLATGMYCYFAAKISELLDTIFFVLRKKQSQVSFLHVYHHSMIVLASWWIIKYEPTYTTVFIGTLNSVVHIVMYGYYALSTFPALRKYLWWKKYITKMQLVQFFSMFVQITADYIYTGCPPSTFLLSIVFINIILMIVLFSNFYLKSYTKNKADESEDIKKVKKDQINFTDAQNNNNNNIVHQKTH